MRLFDGYGFGSKTGGSGLGSEPPVFIRFLAVPVRFGGSDGFLGVFFFAM